MRRLTCKRPIPIIWYFISQLLVEISIWNSYRALIGSLSIHWKNIDCHRSKVKVTGTVHCLLKVQSYHKNWAIENFQYFFVDTSLYALSTETIKTWTSREITSQKYVFFYLTFNMSNSYTAVNIAHKIVNRNLKNTSVIQPRPTHIIYQCVKCGDNRTSFNVICGVCDV